MSFEHFLSSPAPLTMSSAVAAIIVLEDGRYPMQLRDDRAGIWYPGHWGLFGGAIEEGEDLLDALRREIHEELELSITEARLFTNVDFDLRPAGLKLYSRAYFEVPITAAAWKRVVLHEGTEVRAFTGEEALLLPRLSPYDAFALFLYHERHRLRTRD